MSSVGNLGNEVRFNEMFRRHGADAPKNESVTTGIVPKANESVRSVSCGNGSSVVAKNMSK
jgi:hypothetical protein